MYFELQLSAAVFARVIRNRLRALPLGLDLGVPDPDGELVIDRVVIGDTTTVQREKAVAGIVGVALPAASQRVTTLSPTNLAHFTVPYLQVRQEVKVLLVRAADLETNGAAATPPALTATIFPVFNVSLKAANQTQGGGPLTLTYALAYVEFGAVALELDEAQRAQIAQVAGGLTVASSIVDLGAMSKLMGRPVNAINAGIACDPMGTTVALRADFDIHASPIAIGETFFEAGPADLLGGKDWAMLLDAAVITQGAEQRIKASLAATANMRILADPVGSWDAAEATLRIAADVKLLGACPSFVDDINMDVRIDLGARFSVPTPDHLVSRYRLDSALINNDQVFGCALTGALLYPFAGAALLEQKKVDLKGYLGGIAFGPYFTFGQLVGVINAQKLEDDISDSLGDTCHKISDAEYECTSIVNLGVQLVPTLNSRFVLDWAYGVAEGLVLSGAVVNLGELFMGSIGDITQRGFAWQVLGSCTGNGKNNFRIGNEATVLVAYTPPARLVTARVLDDPAHGYTIAIDDNEITVTPSNPPVPYPCKLRLITNRGVRTVTIAATAPMGVDESEALQTEMLGASMSCYYWEKDFTVIERILWRIDPEAHVLPDGGVHQWQILVKDLDPASTVTVSTPDGTPVLTGTPTRNGTLRFSLHFEDRGAPDELSLELHRPAGTAAHPHEISVHQTLYARRASLPVQGVRRAKVTGGLRRPQLEITTNHQEMEWDVRNPLAPHLLRAVEHGPADPARTTDSATGDHAAIDSDAYDGQQHEVHTHCAPGAFEPMVASLDLMVGPDRSRQGLDLYQVVARTTGSRPTGVSTTGPQTDLQTLNPAPILPEPDPAVAPAIDVS